MSEHSTGTTPTAPGGKPAQTPQKAGGQTPAKPPGKAGGFDDDCGDAGSGGKS